MFPHVLSSSSSSSALLLLLLLLALLPIIAISADDGDQCVYTFYVQTGTGMNAGTDSKIGLTVGDSTGREMSVPDLVSWGGLMGAGHDYFERGSLDVFSARGPCGVRPLCHLNLTSDGTGEHHGWYSDSVEVTATGPHVPCTKSAFSVRRWLATDAWPYQLYAAVDGCGEDQSRVRIQAGAVKAHPR